jgi:hypothetical protein
VTGSYGPAVVKWAKRQLKIDLGGWQEYVLWQLLRHDRYGELLHRIALLSTGRQNGKSVIVRAFFGWLLDEGAAIPPFSSWTTLLAAAHDQRQARIVYRNVQADMETRADRATKIRTTRFFGISSPTMEFDTVSNQPGSARGWSAGGIAWDEMLTQRDWDLWEALAPTQSAQRSPIMILTSTAGHSDSVILRTFYDRLVRQAAGAEEPEPAFYGAWWQSADPAAQLDWDELTRANPSLPEGRITRQMITLEHGTLPPDSWQRERMNHFVDARADAAIHPGAWANCRVPHPLKDVDGPFALGIDVAMGGSRATITVAAVRPDGRIGVEVFRDVRADRDRLVTSQRLLDEVHAFPKQLAYVAFDKVVAAASAFERDAQESTLPWDGLSPGAMVDACMDVGEMISSGRLAVDDPLLDAQAPLVVRRDVGNEGAYRYSRGLSEQPIDAFMAMVLAAHAIAYTLRLPAIF